MNILLVCTGYNYDDTIVECSNKIYTHNYIFMQRIETRSILNPINLTELCEVPYKYTKLTSAEIIGDSVSDTFKLKDLFNRICQITNKKIVYGIKKRRGKEVVELYLYAVMQELGYPAYLNEVITLLNFLSNTSEDTCSHIKQTLMDNKVGVVSYELDDTGKQVTGYLDMYTLQNETLRYNLIDRTLTHVSSHSGTLSHELRNNLSTRANINSDYIPNIMNDLLHITPTLEDSSIPRNVIIHNKTSTNSIGLYLDHIDFTQLNTLLIERFGKSLSNTNGVFTDLMFAVYLDYDLASGTISGFGFCDYF